MFLSIFVHFWIVATPCQNHLLDLASWDESLGLGLELLEGQSRAPSSRLKLKPKRVLLYFWPKDERGFTVHQAVALSVRKGKLLKREYIESRYDPVLGQYRLSFGLESFEEELGDSELRAELSRCSACHSAHPRSGRLQIFRERTAFNIHPDAHRWIVPEGDKAWLLSQIGPRRY